MGVTFINCTLVLCYRLCLSTFLQPQCQGRHKTAWSILIFLRLLFVTIIILRWLMSARQVMVKCNSWCKWVQSNHLHICLLQMIRFKKEWEWISPEARFAAQRREVAGWLEREPPRPGLGKEGALPQILNTIHAKFSVIVLCFQCSEKAFQVWNKVVRRKNEKPTNLSNANQNDKTCDDISSVP